MVSKFAFLVEDDGGLIGGEDVQEEGCKEGKCYFESLSPKRRHKLTFNILFVG